MIGSHALESVALTEESLVAADCVVILTNHSCFPYDRIAASARAIVDTRNALRDHDAPHAVTL
jgi:UDP-N-acetyl-D-glucosamine dehydrogenase